MSNVVEHAINQYHIADSDLYNNKSIESWIGHVYIYICIYICRIRIATCVPRYGANDGTIASQVNITETHCLAEVTNRRLYSMYVHISRVLFLIVCMFQWYVQYVRMVGLLQTRNLASWYVAIAAWYSQKRPLKIVRNGGTLGQKIMAGQEQVLPCP